MIKASELRIGNCVLHQGKTRKIVGVVAGSQIGSVYFDKYTNESAKGRPSAFKGKKHTEEARRKMSEAAKRRVKK